MTSLRSLRCVDVNVLIYSHRSDLREHPGYRDLLEDLANDDELLGVPDLVLTGFLRVITNNRVFKHPTSPDEAWTAVEALIAAPAVLPQRAGSGHWAAFTRLAHQVNAPGDDIADAHLAAYAVENNATWLSADRGFGRFSELDWRHPLG